MLPDSRQVSSLQSLQHFLSGLLLSFLACITTASRLTSSFNVQLLGAYLPGPLNVVKDVLLTKQDEPQVGLGHCRRQQWDPVVLRHAQVMRVHEGIHGASGIWRQAWGLHIPWKALVCYNCKAACSVRL